VSESGGHGGTCEKDLLLAACVLGYHHQSVLNSRGLSVKEEGLPKRVSVYILVWESLAGVMQVLSQFASSDPTDPGGRP
jgi:hypothetical protein